MIHLTESNGHVPTNRLTPEMAQIEADYKLARRRLKLLQVQQQSTLLESWFGGSDWSNSTDLYWMSRALRQQSDAQNQVPPSQPGDRKHGQDWPRWYSSEFELGIIRQRSRLLCNTNSFAKGLLNNLINYLLGKGGTYKAGCKDLDVPPDEDAEGAPEQVQEAFTGIDARHHHWINGKQVTRGTPVPPPTARLGGAPQGQPDVPGQTPDDARKQRRKAIKRTVKQLQDFVDAFLSKNRWTSAAPHEEVTVFTEPREREAIRRHYQDGEVFIRFFPDRDGVPDVRFVEPEQVKNPSGAALVAEGWSHGIQHQMRPREDVERVVAYCVWYMDLTTEKEAYEIVPASEIIHLRGPDTPSTVKRGTPVFAYELADALERASKLQRYLSIGSRVRAAVAETWKFATAPKDSIIAMAQGATTRTYTDPITGRTVNIEDTPPGTRRRIPEGQEPVENPSAVGVSEHMSVLDGDLNQAAATMGMPGFIVSGKADVGSYASLHEAGGLPVLTGSANQGFFVSAFCSVVVHAVRMGFEAGAIPRECLELVNDIQVTLPEIVQESTSEKVSENKTQMDMGTKSPQEIIAEDGRDPEVVLANFAEWKARTAPPPGAAVGPDGQPVPGGPQQPPVAPQPGQEQPQPTGQTEAQPDADGQPPGSGAEQSVQAAPGIDGQQGNPAQQAQPNAAGEEPEEDPEDAAWTVEEGPHGKQLRNKDTGEVLVGDQPDTDMEDEEPEESLLRESVDENGNGVDHRGVRWENHKPIAKQQEQGNKPDKPDWQEVGTKTGGKAWVNPLTGQRLYRKPTVDAETHAKPTLEKQNAAPQVVLGMQWKETQEAAKQLLPGYFEGKEGDLAKLVSLTGAPRGSTVNTRVNYSTPLRLDFSGSSHQLNHFERDLNVTDDGDLVMHNNLFFLKKKHQGGGTGMKVFSDEVANCAAAGVSKIETLAGRGPRMNGYYTWPRFGYNVALDYYQQDAISRAVKRGTLPPEAAQAKDVLDLYKTEQGRAWWKKHGQMVNMEFDLKEGSKSLAVLNDYRKGKGLPPIAGASPEAVEQGRVARLGKLSEPLIGRIKGKAAKAARVDVEAIDHMASIERMTDPQKKERFANPVEEAKHYYGKAVEYLEKSYSRDFSRRHLSDRLRAAGIDPNEMENAADKLHSAAIDDPANKDRHSVDLHREALEKAYFQVFDRHLAQRRAVPVQESADGHFTGIDAHGHKWVDGKQVKREEEGGAPHEIQAHELLPETPTLKSRLHAAAKALYDQLPKPVQSVVDAGLAIEHHLGSYYQAGQELAKAVAEERGLPPEDAERIARICGRADAILRWTANVPAAHAGMETGLHAVVSLAGHVAEEALAAIGGSVTWAIVGAAKVGFYIPVGSLAYVGYSMGRELAAGKNPLATIRRARERIRARKGASLKESYDPNEQRADDGKWTAGGGGTSNPEPAKTNKSEGPKKFGKSKASIVYDTGSGWKPEEIDAEVRKMLKVDTKEIASLVGAPDDATVKVLAHEIKGKKSIFVDVDHPSFTAKRRFFKNASGTHVENDEFWVKEGAQGKGLGSEVFGRQVEQCQEMGIASIRCHAAKENPKDPSKPHNGYYTWPRFGYDASLDADNFPEEVWDALEKDFPDAGSLLDVMATPEGRDWWKKNGGDIYHAQFDLSPGSRSMMIHEAYQAEREQKKAG